MSKMTALTDKQRDFADKNHDLVIRYLREKRLNENDFYDIAVFGYLKAVQIYDQRPELHEYDFKTIAYKRMYASVWNYFRSLKAKKRSAVVYSLNAPAASGMDFSERIYSGDPAVYEYNELREEWETAKSAATPKQAIVLELRARGYSNREIGKAYSLSPSSVSSRICRFKKKITRIAA